MCELQSEAFLYPPFILKEQYVLVHQCLLNWLSRGTVANLDR